MIRVKFFACMGFGICAFIQCMENTMGPSKPDGVVQIESKHIVGYAIGPSTNHNETDCPFSISERSFRPFQVKPYFQQATPEKVSLFRDEKSKSENSFCVIS